MNNSFLDNPIEVFDFHNETGVIKSIWVSLSKPQYLNKIKIELHCDEKYEKEPQIKNLTLGQIFGSDIEGKLLFI